MTDVHILAIDLAKRSFQVCATAAGGAVLFNRMVSHAKLETVLAAVALANKMARMIWAMMTREENYRMA
ncbi:hypothetical protein BH10PSE12_BH10PSE12_06990 [soil metagenome]